MPDHASGQPLPKWVTWACCDQVYDDGTACTGAAQADYGRCLAHLDAIQLASVMTRRPDEAPPDFDARGARLRSDDLRRLLAAARSENAPLHLGRVSLGEATIKGNVSLNQATIKGNVSLNQAMVEGDASLAGAAVEGDVSLGGATIKGGVSLNQAMVEGDVSLFRATVEGGEVSLCPARIRGGVLFDGLVVKAGGVFLHPATVEGEVSVDGLKVAGDVKLNKAKLRRGPLTVAATHVGLSDVRLSGGLTARIDEAEVVMERVEVQGNLVLAHATTGLVTPVSPPRLLQLAGTDVTSLTLTGVDLSACRFSGAINLDKLRIDGSPQLAMREGWQAHRRVLAEEHVWRRVHGRWGRDSWYPMKCQPHNGEEARQILEAERPRDARERAHEIATVYRALRKGREDSKDEPGAADFYYGEMEMRRKAAGHNVEGVLLTAYWLLSGYGLRAWRALTALIALIAAATVLFATVGLARTSVTAYRRLSPPASNPAAIEYRPVTVPGPRPGWVTALNYSVQSTTSLLRSPSSPPPLTGAGQALEIFLRFAGPGLLALAVLALRARVKR